MEANELRIGNWIADRGNKEWQIDYWESKNKVSAKEPEFNTQGMKLKGHPMTEYVDYLQPIPITKQWYYKIDKQLYDLGLEYSHSEITNRLFIYLGIITVQCECVHHIQNLYFSLTGKELTQKESKNNSCDQCGGETYLRDNVLLCPKCGYSRCK